MSMISQDQYKYDACNLTNDECCGGSCRGCETAMAENRKNKIVDAKRELDIYTIFGTELNAAGIVIMSNRENTIAKTDMKTLRRLQDNWENIKISKATLTYCPGNLKQYAEELRKLRRYNGLGIPDMIWGAKNFPAAVMFGDVVYLIAPRIESE